MLFSHVTVEPQYNATLNITLPSILNNRELSPHHTRRLSELCQLLVACHEGCFLKEGILKKSTVISLPKLWNQLGNPNTIFLKDENQFIFSISSSLCISLVSWLLYPPRPLCSGLVEIRFCCSVLHIWKEKANCSVWITYYNLDLILLLFSPTRLAYYENHHPGTTYHWHRAQYKDCLSLPLGCSHSNPATWLSSPKCEEVG